jgi:cyanophycinase
MSGPIGLHGGGEYVAGDEPFLDALLQAAREAAARSEAERETGPGPDADLDVSGHSMAPARAIRVVVVPTAASRGFPDRAAATGLAAFERRASAVGLAVAVDVARVVDAESAHDDEIVRLLSKADLIHLPGGDPDLIPTILADTPALAAIRAASRGGAVVAGASAGAMALAEWTWTPRGGMHGLAFVDGLAVIPHYDDIRRTTWQDALDRLAPGGIGYLGLDERTGVIATPEGSAERAWRVTGPGAAWWFARGGGDPTVARNGELLRLPA